MTRLPSRRIAGILCAIFISTLFAWSAAILPPAPVVHAVGTSWHVTKTADTNDGTCDSDCSLREAIAAASSGDTIDFVLTLPATITLTLGQLSFSTDLTINGSTTSTIAVSGNNASRVFSIGPSHASIDNLTIRDGNAPGNQGGGILIGSTTFLTLTSVQLISNTAQLGGGIYSIYGTMVLTNVTIANNVATSNAGGVQNTCCIGPSSLTITNSTISGNVANGLGGGIVNGGIPYNHKQLDFF